jgi:hypothetical protein
VYLFDARGGYNRVGARHLLRKQVHHHVQNGQGSPLLGSRQR